MTIHPESRPRPSKAAETRLHGLGNVYIVIPDLSNTVMSKSGSRAEEIDEARRRTGMDRLIGRPSDWAADWSAFTNEFLDRLSYPLGFNPAAMVPRALQAA